MDDSKLTCYRCGAAKASVTEPDRICGACLIETMGGGVPSVARTRWQGGLLSGRIEGSAEQEAPSGFLKK